MIQCRRPFICPKMPRNKGFPAIRPFQTEVPVAGFFYLHPVATRVFLHDSSGYRVKIHDLRRETCIFTRFAICRVKIHDYMPTNWRTRSAISTGLLSQIIYLHKVSVTIVSTYQRATLLAKAEFVHSKNRCRSSPLIITV